MGETLGDGLAHAVDPHHQFAFVVHLLRERRDVKRVVVAQQRRVGLEEEHRFLGEFPAVVELFVQLGGMFGVVAAYADDFHALSLFIVVVALCPDHHPDHVNRQVDSEDYGKSLLLAGQFEYCCK